ncbi:MAG: TetR/AcrR family transcriptional regulator [Myxococcales bacterium]|nr:TetR/AcrR family transcriptional regulator [Myxococcales bacterium]
MRRLSAESLRQKILEEATGIVYREGVDRITMRALGEKLGYSPATIYLYFKNKDELLLEIAQHGFERLAERQRPGFDEPDPREALRRVVRGYLGFALENPALYELMFQKLTPARDQADRQPHAQILFDSWKELYARGLRAGVFRIPEFGVAGAFQTSLLHGFALLAISGRMPYPDSELTLSQVRDRLIDELVDLIAPS